MSTVPGRLYQARSPEGVDIQIPEDEMPGAGSAAAPSGTGYVHVTDGEQDAAAGNPLVVEATDADAEVLPNAQVTGTGTANASTSASTQTGDAYVSREAIVATLGNADASSSAQSTTEGNATANTTATAATGDAQADTAAFTTTGNASANSIAEATTGDAVARLVAATMEGTSESSISADAGAHSSGVTAEANDATGATLDINTGDDTGAAGQFLGSDGAGKAVWQTPLVRHAAGVPTDPPGVAELPFAFDSTAVTGGLYFWDGAAWVKCSTIP